MLRDFLLNRKCKALSKRRISGHSTYSASRNIGILFNATEFDVGLIKGIWREMQKEGKKVSLLALSQQESNDNLRFCKKDISGTGAIRKGAIDTFSSQPFDFLISLDTSSDINFKYVLALSKASCKVGLSTRAYRNLLEMSVKPEQYPAMSVKTLMKYLKMI